MPPAASCPDPRQPEKIVANARDILAAGDYPEPERFAMRLLIAQLAVRSGLPRPVWPALDHEADPDAVYAARRHLSGLVMDAWDMRDVSGAYERLLHPRERMDKAAFYTPPDAARFMVRFSFSQAAQMLAADPDPRAVMQILAVDASCGAGVFLVEAARYIATVLANRLSGRPDADLARPVPLAPKLARLMMPEVMTECVFGMDTDPVAVDLARATLWYEVRGEEPVTFMDRNVVVVDSLSGPDAQPPKLAERLGDDVNEAIRICGTGSTDRPKRPNTANPPVGAT